MPNEISVNKEQNEGIHITAKKYVDDLYDKELRNAYDLKKEKLTGERKDYYDLENVKEESYHLQEILRNPEVYKINQKRQRDVRFRENRNQNLLLVNNEKWFGDSTYMTNVKTSIQEYEEAMRAVSSGTAEDTLRLAQEADSKCGEVLRFCDAYLNRTRILFFWKNERYKAVESAKERFTQERRELGKLLDGRLNEIETKQDLAEGDTLLSLLTGKNSLQERSKRRKKQISDNKKKEQEKEEKIYGDPKKLTNVENWQPDQFFNYFTGHNNKDFIEYETKNYGQKDLHKIAQLNLKKEMKVIQSEAERLKYNSCLRSNGKEHPELKEKADTIKRRLDRIKINRNIMVKSIATGFDSLQNLLGLEIKAGQTDQDIMKQIRELKPEKKVFTGKGFVKGHYDPKLIMIPKTEGVEYIIKVNKGTHAVNTTGILTPQKRDYGQWLNDSSMLINAGTKFKVLDITFNKTNDSSVDNHTLSFDQEGGAHYKQTDRAIWQVFLETIPEEEEKKK